MADAARGVFAVLENGKTGGVYNLGSGFDAENIWTVRTVLKLMGKSTDLIKFVPDRPGHDFRYVVSSARLKRLGWKPEVSFLAGVKETIQWYAKHQHWLDKKQNSWDGVV